MIKNLSLCALSLLILVSCKRAQKDEGGSSISIQIPSLQQFKASQSKSQAVAASNIDYNLLCFTVNVKGGLNSSGVADIITTPAATCKIERGLLAPQAVAAGGTLTIDNVPVGTGRVFEVYGFLRNSATDACPATAPDWNWPILKTYFLGSNTADLSKDIEDVPVTITLPQSTQNLAVVKNWPSSCGGVKSATASFGHALVGAQVISSASFHMHAHVADKNLDQTLVSTPSGWTLKGRINGQ